jgi:hypothetical protein
MKGCLLQPSSLAPPNKSCFVCQKAQVNIALDVHQTTIKHLLDAVNKKTLGIYIYIYVYIYIYIYQCLHVHSLSVGFHQPTIMIGEGNIIYEEGEDIDEDEYRYIYNIYLYIYVCIYIYAPPFSLIITYPTIIKHDSEMLVKHLSSLPGGGINNGSIVEIDDFSQNMTVEIVITHKPKEGNVRSLSFSSLFPSPLLLSSIYAHS